MSLSEDYHLAKNESLSAYQAGAIGRDIERSRHVTAEFFFGEIKGEKAREREREREREVD